MGDVTVTGSCLCGSVSYQISGDASQFWHCHCQRCRKATGTGHASNILMKPETIEWTAGKDLLTYYKVPDAKRFAKMFCSVCGSLMPRVAPDKSIAVVPAGSLPAGTHIPGLESALVLRQRGPGVLRDLSGLSGRFFCIFLKPRSPVLCDLTQGSFAAFRRNSERDPESVTR
jgi:hypothetical protein